MPLHFGGGGSLGMIAVAVKEGVDGYGGHTKHDDDDARQNCCR